MITKTITLKEFTWPLEPVPFRYLESLVERIKMLVPIEAEQKTCHFDPVTKSFYYQHTLTTEEELIELADAHVAFRNRVREALDLPPSEIKRVLRELLDASINPVGTPAAPAPGGALTDDQRRDAFFAWTRIAQFKLNTQPRELRDGAAAQGFGTSDIERWLKEPPGTIDRLIAAAQ